MGRGNSRFIRIHDDNELAKLPTTSGDNLMLTVIPEPSSKKGVLVSMEKGERFKAKVLRRVFSEDYEREKNHILDPRGRFIRLWNKIFLGACVLSLFIDPLFCFLPILKDQECVKIGRTPEVILTIIRTVADFFYVVQVLVRFHTAYVAPSSRVFGRGELVIDHSKVALRYLKRGFLIDLLVALPLPQVFIWVILPNLKGSIVATTKNAFWAILIIQYLPRVFLIYPLSSQISDVAGVVTETAWTGAAYNLMLYMLGSHVSGAWWFLLSIERHETCWKSVCNKVENSTCNDNFFDCRNVYDQDRVNWFNSSNVTTLCVPGNTPPYYQYGIYGDAVTNNVLGTGFFNKYFYCLWWGLRNLSSTGQNLSPSTYVGEILFTIFVATLGLVLFALLIGNMQRYLQSATLRLEQWRIKKTDTERWMRHRQLPPELRDSVREYDQYKWLATRGVNEEEVLNGLPLDLRREIKRHLCLSLVRGVPLFNQMDETMLDAICERLRPALCTKNMFLVRESDPVNQMFFIIRGHLDSYTTDGGRTGFFNSIQIGPGDFCGEELLTWALDPRPSVSLPSSTRTVKAITEVEAFSLVADDLKFVASQFRKLHSKQLRHTFRFYSQQWRTWAACFIQVAWRKHKRLKQMAGKRTGELGMPPSESFWSKYAEALVERTRSRRFSSYSPSVSGAVGSLQKPTEPNFD